MNKYLLEFSYIGTRFRGLQKTINKSEEIRVDTKTIQGCLDLALQVFRPVNEIRTVLSSRTDSGVHALHNTLHVELQRYDGEPYNVQSMTGVLNRTLDKQGLPIRILYTRIVPESFHCRYSALGRTYLYRAAVAKEGTTDSVRVKNKNFEAFIPVEELDRCFFLQGLQKTINKSEEIRVDTKTIQGCLDLALQVFRPVNEIKTVLSSRTDSGVHALHNTLHVELQRYDGEPYNVQSMTGVLNRTLDKQGLPIRILNTRIVPESFHCRYSALGRTYLYRAAVAKEGTTDSVRVKNKNFEAFIPVDELDRCFFLQSATFDIDRMRNASRMFLGRHDFRTFMSMSREKGPSRDHPMFTVRHLDQINIRPGKSACIGPNAELADSLYDYWDIEVKGKSFLYKQVRRIVGSLLALATGRVDEKCIYEMLTIPSKHNWDPHILLAPAFGLYLCQVHYNDDDLKLDNKVVE